MNETDLHFFIDSALNYFKQVTGIEAKAGIPYIRGEEPVALEFTGIIGISGKRKGSIYITAHVDMLKRLSQIILGAGIDDEDTLKDLIGEIANTIAGNVRMAYGSEFLISVPVVVQGIPDDIHLPDNLPTFVVPISWESHKAFLVVCLE